MPAQNPTRSASPATLPAFAKLFVAKVSDRRICQTLGVSLTEAHGLVEQLRAIHGVSPLQNLRAVLRGAA